MLDIELIRDDPDRVRRAVTAKRLEEDGLVERLLEVDEKRRHSITRLQEAQHESNVASDEIGALMREGKEEKAQSLIDRSSELKEEIEELEERVDELEARRDELLLRIPNVPHPSVPVGDDEDDNEVVEVRGEKPDFGFEPEPHWSLAKSLGIVDFERGAKVTGAGFPVYVGRGARLQRALIRFFLDLARTEGDYREVQPPLLVNESSALSTGQLPDKEDLMYEIPRDELYLIPTAEVPVTNLYRDEILPEDRLPIRLCAYTPCFRREAGSHGRDVRGLNRLHQFDKVELVQFVRPDRSYEALETLREDAERPLRRLELPYRRLLMCTGDMGFTQAKKYDLEVWSPGQDRYLEVSSVSNFEAFQANRAMIRYRDGETGDPRILHTLNGSGLALPRIVAALLEHYQEEDGTVIVPDALRPYTGFDRLEPTAD